MPVPFWLEAILKGNEVAFMQLLEKYPYIFLETHKMAFLSYVAESYAAESYLPESYVEKLGFSIDCMRKIVAHIKQNLPELDENPFGKVDAAVDALPLALVPGSACAEIRELFLEETSSVQNLCLEHFDSSVRVMRARMITENSDHLLDSKYLKDDFTKEGIQEMLKVFVDRDLHCGIKNYLKSLEVLKRREKEDEKGMIWTEDNTIDICTAMLTYFSKDFESKCELTQSESVKLQNLSETTKIFLKALFSTTAKHLDKSLIEKRLKEKIETLDIPPISKDTLLEAMNSVLDDSQEKSKTKRYKKSS